MTSNHCRATRRPRPDGPKLGKIAFCLSFSRESRHFFSKIENSLLTSPLRRRRPVKDCAVRGLLRIVACQNKLGDRGSDGCRVPFWFISTKTNANSPSNDCISLSGFPSVASATWKIVSKSLSDRGIQENNTAVRTIKSQWLIAQH